MQLVRKVGDFCTGLASLGRQITPVLHAYFEHVLHLLFFITADVLPRTNQHPSMVCIFSAQKEHIEALSLSLEREGGCIR